MADYPIALFLQPIFLVPGYILYRSKDTPKNSLSAIINKKRLAHAKMHEDMPAAVAAPEPFQQ